MLAEKGALAFAATVILALAACSGDGDPRLMNIRSSGDGPDEFAIVPPKPLEMPEDLVSLPEPTPGGSNLTDQQPLDDAVAALGGRPGGGAGGDAALVRQTSRYGVSSGIRQELASADLAFRQDNDGRILERLFKTNVYYRAYRGQSLDQHAELRRWRRAGARNVSAPPAQKGE
ncbi:MAG: DUF3035 domain-containing protein [Pseudorhodobacter sp.]